MVLVLTVSIIGLMLNLALIVTITVLIKGRLRNNNVENIQAMDQNTTILTIIDIVLIVIFISIIVFFIKKFI